MLKRLLFIILLALFGSSIYAQNTYTKQYELSGIEEARRLVRMVDHALSFLAKEEQEVLRARFIERTTCDAAAERFGFSKEHLKKIEVIAIRKMREHITDSR